MAERQCPRLRVQRLEGVKQAFRLFATATPDGRHVIHDLIAEGDRLVARVTGTGTHTREVMGIPPTGKRLEMTGIVIYLIHAGEIVERWAQHNVFGLLQAPDGPLIGLRSGRW
jgi:predicted ester cyclase